MALFVERNGREKQQQKYGGTTERVVQKQNAGTKAGIAVADVGASADDAAGASEDDACRIRGDVQRDRHTRND